MTVERADLVKFWPLVDVGKLDLREGDVIVANSAVLADDGALRRRFLEIWQRLFPGVRCVVAAGDIDFIIKRAMPEMRAEDLDQPERARD